MIGKLVGKLASAFGGKGGKGPSAPEGTRLYAIGDVHGRADLLEDMITRICSDADDAPDLRKIVIFLGDYVDRGLQSREVLDRLSQPWPAGFETVYLKGNHELAMQQFMADPQFGRSWKYYGGLETLHSYGIRELTLSDRAEDFELARQHLNRVFPEAHKIFFARLESSAEFGDYFFAHAGVRPGISLARQVEDDLLWIREGFLDHEGSFGKVVVHGHTPKEEPVFRANRIGIDTGAYMTDRLTCVVLEGQEQRLIQSKGRPALIAAQ